MVLKIVSGAQTGADVGGLLAAEEMGLPTGGWCPGGCRTEEGNKPEWIERFNLTPTTSCKYQLRTILNVRTSDATIIFGKGYSAGSKLTRRQAVHEKKPHLQIPWGQPVEEAVAEVQKFLHENNPTILNIAGNRESRCAGIQEWVKAILIAAIKPTRP